MNYKDILKIENTNLDYYNPVHKLLMDIIAEYCNGPRFFRGQYVCSIYVDTWPLEGGKDWVFIECNPCINAGSSQIYNPGLDALGFPLEILESQDPVQLARIFGLQSALAKVTKDIGVVIKDLDKLYKEQDKLANLLNTTTKEYNKGT